MYIFRHGRMASGGHGLPKVSPGPAMPDSSMPCGRATSETALRQGVGRAACARLLPLWTSYAYAFRVATFLLLAGGGGGGGV
jgi:hypothetical protein